MMYSKILNIIFIICLFVCFSQSHPNPDDHITIVLTVLLFQLISDLCSAARDQSNRQYSAGGGGAELFPCPYPPKVQARTSRDQRPAPRSRVSG